jgi:purine-binding chemotaxis protein CheW
MAETRESADRAPATGSATEGEAQIELLGFMLSDEQYALDILEVKEIVRLHAITPVPRSPPWLKGIVTLRGVIVPIFDLRSRLGLAEIEHGPETRIVVVYRGEELAGLIVDRITQVMRLPVEAIEPPPQTIDQVEAEYLRGVARFRDQLVILLNLPRVVEAAP